MKTTLKFESDTVKKARQFAHLRALQKNNYQNSQNLYRDVLLGTIAEFVVCKYLRRKKIKCSSPDLTIYNTSEEKKLNCCGADLVSAIGNIHVKCCESIGNYAYTWSYNKKSNYTDKDIHALVCVDILFGKYVVEIIGLFLGEDLADYYKDPIIKKYAKTKKCLYLQDLTKLKNLMEEL